MYLHDMQTAYQHVLKYTRTQLFASAVDILSDFIILK